MLESVFQQMQHYFREYGTINYLFEPVENVEDKIIKSYLTKIYRGYQNSKKQGKEIDFFFQTQDSS